MKPNISRVAVLGAGVMGAQIAALFANAKVRVVLFDLFTEGPNPDDVVERSIQRLRTMEPPPLVTKERWRQIKYANYERDGRRLTECDLIVEAITEKLSIKLKLYESLAPYLNGRAILATNTSGLSIESLSRKLSQAQRVRFCGIHFFNPPRYMRLVELVPSKGTSRDLLDELETFLTSVIGKGVIRARDTPNFIANRVGIFSMLAAIHHTKRLGLAFDVADLLTGNAIGRPRSATFGTLDLIGLDTFSHIIEGSASSLHDDPWRAFFKLPAWANKLIAQGALGRKSGQGVYLSDQNGKRVFDSRIDGYRSLDGILDTRVAEILRIRDAGKKFEALIESSCHEAHFLWAIFRDLFHYCAVHLETIADTAREVDFAMRWGFGWRQGAFETWQCAGWQYIAAAIQKDIDADLSMAKVPLPDWVLDGRIGVHTREGSYSPRARSFVPRSRLPVYHRQIYPERLLGESSDSGLSLLENESVRLWRSGENGKIGIGILSIKTKLGIISEGVLSGIVEAVQCAEAECQGMVIWQKDGPFSAGADLKAILQMAQTGEFERIDSYIRRFQIMTRRLKYSRLPIVAAIDGLALGGGCEIAMHCARSAATVDCRIGLVEASVGLIPGGGGCKEYVGRLSHLSADAPLEGLIYLLQPIHRRIASGTAARSAPEAQDFKLLREADTVVFQSAELLYVAKEIARSLFEQGYRPPDQMIGIRVAGRAGFEALAKLDAFGHDLVVARAAAKALTGGDVETGAFVDESSLLEAERSAFMDLIRTNETQLRIAHMLDHGKPLRN